MFPASAKPISSEARSARAIEGRGGISGHAVTRASGIILASLPLIIIFLRSRFLPWVFMWLLAVSIFAACKAQSWLAARELSQWADWKRSAAYLFLWPGMNAGEFLDATISVPRPDEREWAAATAKTLSGAALIWIGVRFAPQPLPAVWVGMVGLILLLHFGAFHLVSLAWRSAGVCARPIMRHPLRSQSLGEFWGKRWNLGFRRLSHDWVFKPLQKYCGLGVATVGAFLASGLIHDLVISFPARAGYGLPTAYFLLQGFGVLVERSTFGSRAGLGRGVRGWLWMALVTAAPAYWLFHPWFAMRVMLPFFRAIGAGC